jgi:hypothetical protein
MRPADDLDADPETARTAWVRMVPESLTAKDLSYEVHG